MGNGRDARIAARGEEAGIEEQKKRADPGE
jgi:hypothetical protein